MKIVFMNEHIREKAPKEPVIVVQDDVLVTESNTFEIRVGGVLIGYVVFDAKGNPDVDTHHVKAWIELHDAVEISPIGRTKCTPRPKPPQASEKKPNRKADLAP